MKPEVIRGFGEYKAGRGAVVTEWCSTRAEAIAAYYRHLAASRQDSR
jgi:hypothetical protein